MADELQALLDKIKSEGVKKAEQQRDEILDQAQKDADKLIADAREQATKIIADATAEAGVLTQKGEEALRQAARDILLTLRQELQQKVQNTVSSLVKETFDGEQLAVVIATIVTSFIEKNGENDDITVLVNQSQLDTLEGAVKAKLAENLRQHCTLAPAPGLAAGFKIVFNQNDVMYDFSDQALAEAVATYVGPKIASILR